jgi:hypothetical protein
VAKHTEQLAGAKVVRDVVPTMTDRDESYIIDLCDRVLGLKAKRQHLFVEIDVF